MATSKKNTSKPTIIDITPVDPTQEALAPSTPPTSQELVAHTPKQAAPRKLRINITQARSLAQETKDRIEREITIRKQQMMESLEWIAAWQQYQLDNPLLKAINEFTNLIAPEARQLLREINQLGNQAYNRKELKYYWSDKSLVEFSDTISSLKNNFFKKFFEKELAELEKTPTLEQIINRIHISTIPLNTQQDLEGFQLQVISELVPVLVTKVPRLTAGE